MKKVILVVMMFFVGVVSWVAYSQDPVLDKIDKPALETDIRQNDENAEALVWLIRRAINSKQIDVAYATLDKMRHEQPNNAVVLSAYAMAHDAPLYQVHKKSGEIRKRTKEEDRAYEAALDRAIKIDPELWLPYTLKGFRLGYAPPWNFSDALDLLHKATQLAPKSAFARKQFAQILQLAANNNGKWKDKIITHKQAVAEYEIAHKLNPDSSDIAYAIFSIYDIDLNDREHATQAKRAFLKTLPPNYKLSAFVQDRLARYPD